MTTTRATAFALLVLGAVAVQAPSRAARPGAPANGTSIVHVAPPAGDVADRERIVTALEQARPGDTIQFARGIYLVGKLITVATPRLTFLGHAQGTTLRGCNPAAYEDMERAVVRPTPQWRAANGAGIWISPGSDENEIAGNTFANIAVHAVVLAGDRNRAEARSLSDRVRDLGRNNRVTRSDPSPGSRGDTVQVAAPTGRHEIDRASILAALERVQPGGTIRFASGT